MQAGDSGNAAQPPMILAADFRSEFRAETFPQADGRFIALGEAVVRTSAQGL
jgi:hypothetical protein